MSTAPPFTPADRLLLVLQGLGDTVIKWGLVQRIMAWAVNRMIDRVREARRSIRRLAARIAAGTYKSRRSGPRRQPDNPLPRTINPVLRRFGWLDPMLPEAPLFRGELLALCDDAEVQALIQAAPAEMARILRPIFWALKLRPPPLLAAPGRRRATPPAPAARRQNAPRAVPAVGRRGAGDHPSAPDRPAMPPRAIGPPGRA